MDFKINQLVKHFKTLLYGKIFLLIKTRLFIGETQFAINCIDSVFRHRPNSLITTTVLITLLKYV